MTLPWNSRGYAFRLRVAALCNRRNSYSGATTPLPACSLFTFSIFTVAV